MSVEVIYGTRACAIVAIGFLRVGWQVFLVRIEAAWIAFWVSQ